MKQRATHADQKAAADLLEVEEAKGELSTTAQKRKEFKVRLSKAKTESGRRLTILNIMLLKQARMEKIWHGLIDQLVSVSDGFLNRLGDDIVDSFCIGLEGAYFYNLD